MPLVFRVMEVENAKPKLGDDTNMLGVRIPPHPHADIIPDANNNVRPGIGGLSVAPNWRSLPAFLIPKRLNRIVNKARASNRLRCWRLGDGAFVDGKVADNLILRCDGATHGLIEPASEMSIDEFQQALAETQDSWEIDEN